MSMSSKYFRGDTRWRPSFVISGRSAGLTCRKTRWTASIGSTRSPRKIMCHLRICVSTPWARRRTRRKNDRQGKEVAGPLSELDPGVIVMLPSSHPPQPPSEPERSGTLLETDEEIRLALQTNRPSQAVPAKDTAAPKTPPPTAHASPYRPTLRPPIAVLTVFDDGKSEGE